jgi:hypothetical protein
MKKVFTICLLAFGLTLVSLDKVAAQSSGEAGGAITAFQIVPNNPFDSMAAGVRSVWEDVFGPSLNKSMAGMLADTMIMDSMESAMSPYGGKMSALPATHLQNEFAALKSSATVFGLESQVASGSSRVWASLTRQEKLSLKTDEALSKMTGN